MLDNKVDTIITDNQIIETFRQIEQDWLDLGQPLRPVGTREGDNDRCELHDVTLSLLEVDPNNTIMNDRIFDLAKEYKESGVMPLGWITTPIIEHDYPSTVKYNGKQYYKIRDVDATSVNAYTGIKAMRYTDDINGKWNDATPVYVDAHGDIMWD